MLFRSVVERNYPDTYKRFTSLGPLLSTLGEGGKGLSWKVQEEIDFLKRLNGAVLEEGDSKGRPVLNTDIDAVETILTLSPESNGEIGVKAWKSLEEKTGLQLTHLAAGQEETKMRYRDLVEQPQRSLVSPIWSGAENDKNTYTANYVNINELVPWRT